jgi:hypothetical protein
LIENVNLPNINLPNTKNKHKWLLAAAFGTGNNANSSEFQKTDKTYDEMGLSGSNNNYATNASGGRVHSFSYMNRKDFDNISHSLPFSFGITGRRMFGNTVGLESGLVYTFLSSRFEWTNWADYNAHQNLHYIGIPFNLIIYLGNSKSSSWKFYFLGGLMLEKGLRALYKQEEKSGNQIRTTTVKSSIDGVQWSLNGSLGVSYKLEKNWHIHFEPRVGYSFDDNQPTSIRTEYPVYFGINLGLNYKFN